MTLRWAILAAAVGVCNAQEILSSRIQSLRVSGSGPSSFPVTLLAGSPITITFDVDETNPPNFQVKVFHCDANWERTNNVFINDELRNFTKFPLAFTPSPAGVHTYTYSYAIQLPGPPGIEQFRYSGNYIFEVWDEDGTEPLGRGKFYVAETKDDESVRVYNFLRPSETAPRNRVNEIVVSYNVPPRNPTDPEGVIPSGVRTVAIVKNRETEFPYIIDVDDRNPDTFVEGLTTDRLVFVHDNVPAGNEYRRLDLTNIDLYPSGSLLRSVDGPDVSRYLHQGGPDFNGTSILVTGSRYAEMLQFEFDFLCDEQDPAPLYVLGDFNGWKPTAEWRMSYDETNRRYILRANLRRGAYDYEYVKDGNDAFDTEGNDWQTVNLYTALVYYHDVRYGGFDRIVRFGQKQGPGGSTPTAP